MIWSFVRLPLLLLAFVVAGVAGNPAFGLEIQRVVSPGGVEAWLVEDHKVPVLALEFSLPGGAAADPAGKEGLAAMTAGLLDEGADDYDSQEFARRLQDDAITLGFEAGLDRFTGNLRTLTSAREAAVALMALALTKPRFDAEAIERQRNATLAELQHEAADPNRVARRLFYAELFPGHPYGRDSRGTAETVAGLNAEDLRSFAGRILSRERLLVAVSGDITPAELGPLLDRLFGGLPAGGAVVEAPEVRPANPGAVVVAPRPMPQSIMLLGSEGLKRDDPDWFPAMVMNYVLGGGGFSSRLTEEVREKRGLTYGVSSYLLPFEHAGVLVAGASTLNEKAGEALALIKAEWQRMAAGGITETELVDARTYLTGSFPLQFTSTAAIARIVLQVRQDRLGIDYLDRRNRLIDSVTAADVQRAARRLLDPARLTVVVVGQPQGLTPTRTIGGAP